MGRAIWIFVVVSLALIALGNLLAGSPGGGVVIGVVAYLLYRRFLAEPEPVEA